LYLLSQECKSNLACERLNDLKKAIDRNEPKNADLYYETSQMAARLCGGDPKVLKLSFALIEHAQQMKPENSRYLSEQAYQLMLMGRYECANLV